MLLMYQRYTDDKSAIENTKTRMVSSNIKRGGETKKTTAEHSKPETSIYDTFLTLHNRYSNRRDLVGERDKEEENQLKENHEAPWKDNRSRRVSNIDEAPAFCANVNFNRSRNSPSFACEAASAASLAIPIRAYDCPKLEKSYM